MLLLIIVTFSLLVIAIGLTTAKLNAKVPCDHNWVETENDEIRCTKCYRVIHHSHDAAQAEAEIHLVKDKPVRPEGIRVSRGKLKDAS